MNSAIAAQSPLGDSSRVRVRECKHGLFCYMTHDIFIGRALDLYGEYSEFEVSLFASLLKPGMFVIEVGSNIGTHTVPLAKIVGKDGRIVAFEPQRVIFQQLCANVAINGLFNVLTLPFAVGAVSGKMGVPPLDYTKENNFGGVALVISSNEDVPVVRLDDYPFAPNFIKIDCEGMELDVIVGASEKIKTYRPMMYVENDRSEKSSVLISALMDRGYDMWWHTPLLYNPDNWRKNKENVYDRFGSCNMLCAPMELAFKAQMLRKVSGPADTWDAVDTRDAAVVL